MSKISLGQTGNTDVHSSISIHHTAKYNDGAADKIRNAYDANVVNGQKY